jgi:hypothetical protein
MSYLETTAADQAFNRLLQLVADVIGVVNDPDGAAKRLGDLAAATAAAQAAIKGARTTMKQADDRTASFKAELAQHEDFLLRARQAHEKEVVAFERTRGALIDEAKMLRDQARADADQASAKLKELNAKLAAIQSAAAA